MRSKQTSQLHTPVVCQWVRSQTDDKAKQPFLLNELTVCIKALVSSVITHTARTVYREVPRLTKLFRVSQVVSRRFCKSEKTYTSNANYSYSL
jgi:hypothetical protein